MNLEPKLRTPFLTFDLPDAEVQMIPEVEVPIPPCDPLVRELPHEPYKCPNIVEHDHSKLSHSPGTLRRADD